MLVAKAVIKLAPINYKTLLDVETKNGVIMQFVFEQTVIPCSIVRRIHDVLQARISAKS
jgi:hypothetical protein